MPHGPNQSTDSRKEVTNYRKDSSAVQLQNSPTLTPMRHPAEYPTTSKHTAAAPQTAINPASTWLPNTVHSTADETYHHFHNTTTGLR